MSFRPRSPHRSVLAVTGSVVLGAALLAAPPGATARTGGSAGGSGGGSGGPTVVATGLNSPRHLSFGEDGALYVAEAGTGGTAPCVTGPTGEVCFGRTGSVTRVGHGGQRRVLTGLPSLAGEGGAEPIGPAAVEVGRHGEYLLNVGLGQDTTARAQLGRAGRRMGTLVAGRIGGRSRVVADWAAVEAAKNPDHSEGRDSDPTGFALTRGGVVATDSGGNTLVQARHEGRVRALAVFGEVDATAPDGTTIPMQAVPTAVAVGPHGDLFVSQLTGFPFPAGAAHIFRVRPGHAPTVYASGLTNVTDLTWSHGRLYAVEIASQGLLSPTGFPTPKGSLVRVRCGDNSMPDTVAGNLDAPYGVAVRHGSAYVTTGTITAGGGTVTRIPLS
jgi:hypothetical protein